MYSRLLFILVFIQATRAEEEKHTVSVTDPQFWGSLIVVFVLVLLSGLLAGLTLGLMTLDEVNLYILSVAGSKKEQVYASNLLPIRKNGHLLLTCLVLSNTVINETLPIILDGMFGKGYIAVVVSTVLIVLFSEIIPQAICSKHGLALGSFFYLPIKLLIGFWFIIAWPISKVLEWMIGSHRGIIYTPQGLSELVDIHSVNGNHGGKVDINTVHLISTSLKFQELTIGQKANHQDSLLVSHDKMLDAFMISDILKTGFLHAFVYNEDSELIVGVFNTAILSFYNATVLASNIPLDPIVTVTNRDETVMDIFTLLVKSSSKFCFLKNAGTDGETVIEMSEDFPEKKNLKKTYSFGQIASVKQLALDDLMSELVN